ncbi:MAG TPA: hypothetical protein VJT67_02550 [Longimicrobiaceae bacterium]|nr:hypothetical protein [Longimicrobiaceae bacterium]
MSPPLLLYSTSTWLAYSVAERFYGGVHYAWCSPVYDGRTAPAHVNIPPSASPGAIYRLFRDDSERGDLHSGAINRNAAGIGRGVEAKRLQGVIGPAEEEEIAKTLELSTARDFRPVLFVIPYEQVREIVVQVRVDDRAHPMSVEYLVEALPRAAFDMIELNL